MRIINRIRTFLGSIQTINIDNIVIKWHKSDEPSAYPSLLNSLDELGYQPYRFNSFIQGYWEDEIFNVTTGKHRAAALKMMGVKHAECIVISAKEGKRREKSLLPENPVKYFSAKIMEEMKHKNVISWDKDKEIMDILKKNILEIMAYGKIQG